MPWNLTITVLLDTDDDGIPTIEGPGALVEDLDDDNDGRWTFETNTGVFLGLTTSAQRSRRHRRHTGTTPRKCRGDPTNASDASVDTDGTADALARTPTVTAIPHKKNRVFLDPMNATSIPSTSTATGRDALPQPGVLHQRLDASTGSSSATRRASTPSSSTRPLRRGRLSRRCRRVWCSTPPTAASRAWLKTAARSAVSPTIAARAASRIIEVEVTFTYAKDSDGDGLPT